MSLICVAAGNPPPTITWTLDDESLPTADDDDDANDDNDDQKSRHVIVSSVTPDGDVVSYVNVSSVRVTDGGTYRCTATNRVGVESFSGKLFVYGTLVISTVNYLFAMRNGVVYDFGRVCLSVCQNFESLDVGSSYLHIRCT